MPFTRCCCSAFPPSALPDPTQESDEVYINAGEKGWKQGDPARPPRRRANKRRGHGTWANDRPPIHGVVGRASGQIRAQVGHVLPLPRAAEAHALLEGRGVVGRVVLRGW